MSTRKTARDAANPGRAACGRILPLGEPSTFVLAARDRLELVQLAGNAPVYDFILLGSVDVSTIECGEQSPVGRLARERIRLRLDAQQRVAIEAGAQAAVVNVAPAAAPRLLIDRIYAGRRGARTLSPRAPVPGSTLQLLLDVAGVLEGTKLPAGPPRVSFVPRAAGAAGAPIVLPVTFGDAGLFRAARVKPGDRRIVDVTIPADAPPGFGRLTVDWGGDLYLDGVDFEIADPALVRVRNRLARRASVLARRFLREPAALIGPWSPLPTGAELCEGLTSLHIASVREDDTFLFYAFDPESRFEQKRTIWFLANWRTKQLELFDRPSWPDVIFPGNPAEDDGITCRGSRWGIDFGSPDNQRNQFFGGVLFQDGAPVAPPRPRVPQRAPASPLAGLQFVGGTAANCPRITKIAILVQFDDNTAPQNRDGVPIPDFDDVMQRERDLVRALGFDQVFELKPDDFITMWDTGGRPKFQRPTRTEAGSVQPLLARIDQIIQGIRDCCTEIVIFINSHQSEEGYLRYRNRDVPNRKDPTKTTDVTDSISQAFLARLVAEQIQRSTAAAGLPCQPPAELIFHTCFSGRFANGDFDKANRAGLGITASSAGGQTTKGKRNGGAATTDEYYFLEALEECVRQMPGRPIAEIFDCIRDGTNRRSDGTQRPVRKPPARP